MRTLFTSILFLCCAVCSAQNLLNNGDHIVGAATIALSALGVTGTYVDQNCRSNATVTVNDPTGATYDPNGCNAYYSSIRQDDSFFVTPYSSVIVTAGAGTPYVWSPGSIVAGGTTSHAPYTVINQSSGGYTLTNTDQANYTALKNAAAIFAIAYCGTPGANDYPPVAFTTILPNQSPGAAIPQMPVNSTGCGYQYGIEFSAPVTCASGTCQWTLNGTAVDASTPSAATEDLSAVLVAMKKLHAGWTWGDVKGALRQTASNWAGGYVAYNATGPAFGYGNINYSSANAVSNSSNVYLQPPGIVVQNAGYYVTYTLYPFVTTRRAKEVIYAGGTWPAASSVNEMTAAQVAAAGGTKIYDDGGASGIQTFSYAPAATGSVTLTVLTLDTSGNASRVESFAQSTQAFVIGTSCWK